jgi:hypothetical protein
VDAFDFFWKNLLHWGNTHGHMHGVRTIGAWRKSAGSVATRSEMVYLGAMSWPNRIKPSLSFELRDGEFRRLILP